MFVVGRVSLLYLRSLDCVQLCRYCVVCANVKWCILEQQLASPIQSKKRVNSLLSGHVMDAREDIYIEKRCTPFDGPTQTDRCNIP